MYFATKEEYMKLYKKQYECLYEQLKKDGYDIDKQVSKEESDLYNKEYRIVKTHWNSFPNEDFSKVVFGTIGSEIRKNECKRLLGEKENYKYLGFEVGSYDSVVEYYFDEKKDILLLFLYHYDVYKPESKIYKRHPRFLEVVFESKIEGKIA